MRRRAHVLSCIGNKEECDRAGAGVCTDNGANVGEDIDLYTVSLFEHISKQLCIGKTITVGNKYGSVLLVNCLFPL